jgi:uncharacterized RDD family membrane protein YckC
MTEVITNKVDLQKADVGARLVSYILDLVILFIIAIVIGLTFGGLFIYGAEPRVIGIIEIVSSLGFLFGYYTYFFGNGQTPGMKRAKIKLCRTDGTYPIGYGRGFFRCVGMIISSQIFGLGYLWILIDKDKQGWHDKIADTYVVKL